MTIGIKKIILIFAMLAFLAASLTIFFKKKESMTQPTISNIERPTTTPGAQIAPLKDEKLTPIEIHKKANWNPMGDPASAMEIRSWFEAHGNYSFSNPYTANDYQNYDISTLQKLSDAGDIRAMHMMADKSKNFSDLKVILTKAAIYGSTEALIQLGSLNENDEGSLRAKSEPEKRLKILEALAYYEAAQMRGDWWGNIASGKSLIERYGVNPSARDKEEIQSRALDIYNQLQAQRIALGLCEFNNDTPDSVIKFYEKMLRPL